MKSFRRKTKPRGRSFPLAALLMLGAALPSHAAKAPAKPTPTPTPKPIPTSRPTSVPASTPTTAPSPTSWARGKVIQCVPVPLGQRVIALTFDDGPDPVNTPQILRVLADYKVPATFFMMGSHVSENPQVAQSVLSAGHAIGNHTWSHLETPPDPAAEVQRTDALMQSVLGFTPTLFRPPFGNLTNGVATQAIAQNDAVVLWSSDPTDWAMPGTDKIIDTVVNQATPGGIVLMHDGGGDRTQTIAALPTIIRQLKARGYTFVTVPQLIALNDKVGGDGLSATYFDNADFTGKQVSRIDPQVNFNWQRGAPMAGFGVDTFSVRWTGQVKPLETNTYTFTTVADDGVRLWVNNQLIINDWNSHAAATRSGQINLLAGQRYDIRLEYFENTSTASVQLGWSSYLTPQQIIPKSQLFSKNPYQMTAPTVAITTPIANYSYLASGTASGVAASTSGGGLAGIGALLFRYSDGAYWNNDAWTTSIYENTTQGTSNWTYTLPPLTDGRYAIQAAAHDGNGLTTYAPWLPFYIDTTPPTVSVTTPVGSSGASGVASDNVGVSMVRGQLWNSATNLCWDGSAWTTTPTDVTAQGTYDWAQGIDHWTLPFPTLPAGNYTFRASATDYIGFTGFTPTIAFTVTP